MNKYPQIVMWEGVQIEELSHEKLCEIIMKLVSERDAARAAEYKRQLHAFDHVKSWRVAL